MPLPTHSAACSKQKVQLSCFQAPQSSSPTLLPLQSVPQSCPGKVQGVLSELLRVGCQLICLHALRAGSSTGPGKTTDFILVCCPSGVQGLFFYVLQMVKGKACSPTSYLGPALPPAPGSKGGGSFPHPCHHMAERLEI